jgi:lipopolysaccharide biosynthesis regulator YciM
MENTKLTPEEVAKLQEIQQKNAAIVSELGNLEITKLQMEGRRANAIEFLNSLREEEQTFGKELSDKYGNGSIDLENGEFIPTPTAE